MKEFYYALALVSFCCMGAECDDFAVWMVWEAVCAVLTLFSIHKVNLMED